MNAKVCLSFSFNDGFCVSVVIKHEHLHVDAFRHINEPPPLTVEVLGLAGRRGAFKLMHYL